MHCDAITYFVLVATKESEMTLDAIVMMRLFLKASTQSSQKSRVTCHILLYDRDALRHTIFTDLISIISIMELKLDAQSLPAAWYAWPQTTVEQKLSSKAYAPTRESLLIYETYPLARQG